tara:strand:+ start:42077 stop:42985 length:909 start_codon:yes stop_codon:yes gene_type:complete
MEKKEFKTFDFGSLSNIEKQGFLSSAIAPRPICFASTVDLNGKVNLSPFSFFNVFSYNPPIMVFSPSRRGRDNTTKDTYENLLQVPEVTINIVNYSMVEQMSLASTEYEKGVNEFIKAGFTEIPSDTIKPPRVAESPVSFECTVDDIIELGKEGGAGNLVLSRVQKAHISTDFLDDDDQLITMKLDLVGRMGGSWYTRSSGDSLFEIPKPLRTMGIGVDQLPKSIRESNILTANNLGRLGNLEDLPTIEQILTFKAEPVFNELLSRFSGEELKDELHHLAKDMLENGDTVKALVILCSLEDE